MSQENVELVERVVDALNRGDVEALLAVVTDDFDSRPPAHGLDGVAFRGHDGMRVWMERLAETWSELDLSTSVLASTGEQAVVAHDIRLVGRDSGVPLNRRFFTTYTMREGKVASAISYPNERDALGTVGLLE